MNGKTAAEAAWDSGLREVVARGSEAVVQLSAMLDKLRELAEASEGQDSIIAWTEDAGAVIAAIRTVEDAMDRAKEEKGPDVLIRAVEPDNAKRADWADEAVRVFAAATGLSGGDVYQFGIRDLMGDLLHLCGRRGLDPQAEMAAGVRAFEEEQAEEQTGGAS